MQPLDGHQNCQYTPQKIIWVFHVQSVYECQILDPFFSKNPRKKTQYFPLFSRLYMENPWDFFRSYSCFQDPSNGCIHFSSYPLVIENNTSKYNQTSACKFILQFQGSSRRGHLAVVHNISKGRWGLKGHRRTPEYSKIGWILFGTFMSEVLDPFSYINNQTFRIFEKWDEFFIKHSHKK